MGEVDKIEPEERISSIEIWDNSKRARVVLIMFWVLIGLTGIGVVSDYLELELLKKAQLEYFINQNEADSNDLRQKIIGSLQTIGFIIASIVFLNWFRRAYGNLHRIGIHYMTYKESMAIWSWFIPIIVLFRPVKIMYEIWRKTQECIKKLDCTYQIKRGGVIIGIWWTLFIISNFIGRYLLKVAFKQETIEQLIVGSRAFLISDTMQISEALLVLFIVNKLSKMELKLAQEIKKEGGVIVHK